MPVKFYEQDISARLKDKRRLSAYLEKLARKHLKVQHVTLAYIFCSDEHLHKMNRQFLNHDTLTDIITFDMSEFNDTLEGEMYISVERIKDNAAKFGVSYADELHRVIFHGALHLCGFKDKKKEDIKEMRAQEAICLKGYTKFKEKEALKK